MSQPVNNPPTTPSSDIDMPDYSSPPPMDSPGDPMIIDSNSVNSPEDPMIVDSNPNPSANGDVPQYWLSMDAERRPGFSPHAIPLTAVPENHFTRRQSRWTGPMRDHPYFRLFGPNEDPIEPPRHEPVKGLMPSKSCLKKPNQEQGAMPRKSVHFMIAPVQRSFNPLAPVVLRGLGSGSDGQIERPAYQLDQVNPVGQRVRLPLTRAEPYTPTRPQRNRASQVTLLDRLDDVQMPSFTPSPYRTIFVRESPDVSPSSTHLAQLDDIRAPAPESPENAAVIGRKRRIDETEDPETQESRALPGPAVATTNQESDDSHVLAGQQGPDAPTTTQESHGSDNSTGQQGPDASISNEQSRESNQISTSSSGDQPVSMPGSYPESPIAHPSDVEAPNAEAPAQAVQPGEAARCAHWRARRAHLRRLVDTVHAAPSRIMAQTVQTTATYVRTAVAVAHTCKRRVVEVLVQHGWVQAQIPAAAHPEAPLVENAAQQEVPLVDDIAQQETHLVDNIAPATPQRHAESNTITIPAAGRSPRTPTPRSGRRSAQTSPESTLSRTVGGRVTKTRLTPLLDDTRRRLMYRHPPSPGVLSPYSSGSQPEQTSVPQDATGPNVNTQQHAGVETRAFEGVPMAADDLENVAEEPRITREEIVARMIASELAPYLTGITHPPERLMSEDNEEELGEQSADAEAASQLLSELDATHTDQVDWLEQSFGTAVSAVRLVDPLAPQVPSGRTDSIYADEWNEIEAEQKEVETPARIRPEGPAVKPLSSQWEDRLSGVMALPNSRQVASSVTGEPLTKKDLATCYTRMAWLNDEIINAYLSLIVAYLRKLAGNDGRHDKPLYHAFNTFFFSNLRDKGYQSVRRWASRAKIGGKDLLNVDTVFIPVHNNSHWTLIVVKPSARQIEHFDSLGSASHRHVALVKSWLKEELGPLYIDDEWTLLPSISPQQNNGSDCGVFLLTTAKAIAFGIEPTSYGALDTPLLRRKICAELMNSAFEGEFMPTGSL